jgi:hypothetical protein
MYFYGHKMSDMDSVAAAFAYARYLRNLLIPG